jgi:hypothetical protein
VQTVHLGHGVPSALYHQRCGEFAIPLSPRRTLTLLLM